MIEIIIPTCRPREALADLVAECQATVTGDVRVIATCLDASAAANRNAGLDLASEPRVVMIDDDITGLMPGWAETLLEALAGVPGAVMVSARLVQPDGRPGQMLGDPDPADTGVSVVERRELPTACIAILNDGTRFDEGFMGSGWEDTDYCSRLRGVYPDGRFLVHNGVRVIHRNEQKRQGANYGRNRARYEAIWGPHP